MAEKFFSLEETVYRSRLGRRICNSTPRERITMSDETERPTKTEDEVEGHSFHKPTKPTKPTVNDEPDSDSPDVEGHSAGKPVFKPTKPV